MNTSITFGSVIKLKFRGRKQPFRILKATDVIKEGDACTSPLLLHNPLCYEETLKKFIERMSSLNWDLTNTGRFMMSSQSIGETPSDEHTARIYIRPLYK